jgi:KDO2-lipid IV(A) lauroyltransferase
LEQLKYFLEYALLRALEFALCSLPLPWALKLGEGLGLAMSRVLKRRRLLIVDNLTRAFPEKKPAEIQRIAHQNWKNLGRTALEFVRSQDFMAPEKFSRIRWENVERVDAVAAANKPILFIVFHFANWEILGMATQARFKKIMAIARPIKNPYVENWIKNKRAQGGMKITLHRDAVKESLRWLKNRNMLGLLVDQNLYHGGVFVNFFGRPAATTTLPALLRLRTDAVIFVAYALREEGTFRLVYEPLVLPAVENEADRLVAYTQAISDHLERVIRKYPENWFWIHNRWKRKPEPAPVA